MDAKTVNILAIESSCDETSAAIIQDGKVLSNLMVDMNPSNVKLRDRAVRLVRELTGKDEAAAREALDQHDWVVKNAVQSLR